ncbi:MAG: carbon monoxide dehydrogenase subunit G [Thaumarchaeota archaeon]|nr:carbon monoxide dehydrogenase subunit G [Nitrososphaerota archaeon]
MHFEGEFSVKAPRKAVFEFLTDPKRISACMPDLQSLEVKSPDDFTAVIKAGISFIKGDFKMHFTTVEKQPPSHAKLLARGSGMGSTIDLETTMDLAEADGKTNMKWLAEARVGGRIASVGQRLLSGQAEKTIKQLFGCLQGQLEKA